MASDPSTMSVDEVNQAIIEQGNKVRSLKSAKADKALITASVNELLRLKEHLKSLGADASASSDASAAGFGQPNAAKHAKTSTSATPAATDADDKKFTLKTPKGTRDFLPEEMTVREGMFAKITEIFQKHGGVTIETPVFELKEILSGKYGEDSKLIYDLQDQGGELASLRYDLTVPFARYLAMRDVSQMKRYCIAKVYRRDNPSVAKGRMREFYQCDFDIAGEYESQVPDAEAIKIMVELLTALDIGGFVVKVNNRKLLDGMFAVCGVPPEKFRTISSAVDKLDKTPWSEVKQEMTEEKGLPEDVADRIGTYVKLHGSKDLVQQLKSDTAFMSNASAKAGVEEMELLFKYLEIFGVVDKVSFDLSLARGLDYYTGVIYEAVFTATSADEAKEIEGVGSIAGGGRYDNLVGMFSPSGKKIPCVGISIGVERVFSILMKRVDKSKLRSTKTEVYVMAMGKDGLLEERMRIAKELWEAGIKAEYMYKAKPRRDAQFSVVDRENIPYGVFIGASEVEQGIVKIKTMYTKIESEGDGVVVNRHDMVAELKRRLLEKHSL
ncbi:histidine---tRNA ligase [Synchytrium microbalum]|uniref:Histidine--tRNA ligase, mitochondrial n=1 Tax=Synchytrium microbalum TaxID=1806994 RepID=A0A507BW68_9FUNG|nr:histidine---tRNA ligase [Synchytrium microbalum]TPX31712.1 histidine---tRNA ligase [Synchytrium microbalum]